MPLLAKAREGLGIAQSVICQQGSPREEGHDAGGSFRRQGAPHFAHLACPASPSWVGGSAPSRRCDLNAWNPTRPVGFSNTEMGTLAAAPNAEQTGRDRAACN